MPYSEITSVTVSHIYDDNSKADFRITKGEDESGVYVDIQQDGDHMRIQSESWEEIRDQIDSFFGLEGE